MITVASVKAERRYDEFEIFVETHFKPMMSAALNVLGNRYDAEDAVMDALVSISRSFDKIKTLDAKAKKVYACRSARNRALNILNSRNKINMYEMPLDEAEERFLREDNGLYGLEGSVTERAADCLALLPAKYKDVMFLYYVEEMNAAAIAKELAMNKKTVQTRLLRGRKMLKELLEKEGVI